TCRLIEPDGLVVRHRKTLNELTPCRVWPVQIATVSEILQCKRHLKTDVEKPKVVIAHVVFVPFPAEFQGVVPNGFRNVVIELNLSNVASLRPDKIVAGKPNAARTVATKAGIPVVSEVGNAASAASRFVFLKIAEYQVVANK